MKQPASSRKLEPEKMLPPLAKRGKALGSASKKGGSTLRATKIGSMVSTAFEEYKSMAPPTESKVGPIRSISRKESLRGSTPGEFND